MISARGGTHLSWGIFVEVVRVKLYVCRLTFRYGKFYHTYKVIYTALYYSVEVVHAPNANSPQSGD